MSLTTIWQHYQSYGIGAAGVHAVTSFDYCYLTFLEVHAGRPDQALAAARKAADLSPGQLLPAAAATYLEQTIRNAATPGVYVAPEGFGAFIRGGGNVPLYQATSAALRRAYERYKPATLLDIGPGDGHALLPALTPAISRIDLVESAPILLEHLEQALHTRGRRYRAFDQPIQIFIQQAAETWDLVQATYSLQSIPPADLPAIFEWLHKYARRLLFIEFDVPEFGEQAGPERGAYVIERYEQGLAEYDDPHGIVAQGFLMPILFSSFASGAARSNYEVPAAIWRERLKHAGFTAITVTLLYDYWWAPAFLIEATGGTV
jgi:hypothetical protein